MKLKNNRLEITFADACDITSPRFDHTAWITEVLLDNNYSFCMPEQLLPHRRNSHGSGLCGEFVLATGELAKAGEYFFKPGVGHVKQTNDFQRFNIFGTYEFKAFQVTAEQISDTEISFYQKGIPCNGYCVDIRKNYHLQDNRLTLEIEATNTGSEAFSLSEYQHNFVSLDGMPTEPGYILELPCDKNLLGIEQATLRQVDEALLPSAVYVQASEIHWKESMDEKILYHESSDIDPKAPARWILRHEQSPISVTEEVDFCPSMVIIWSVEHCICPEFYNTIQLTPGETARWHRTWTFEH